jgi:hypothetical protein
LDCGIVVALPPLIEPGEEQAGVKRVKRVKRAK